MKNLMRFICLFLLLSPTLFGQNTLVYPTPEYFEQVMKTKKPNLEELKMMVKIGSVYWQHNRDSATQIYHHIIECNDSIKTVNYYALGRALEGYVTANNGDLKKAEQQILAAKARLIGAVDPWIKGQIDYTLAVVYGMNLKSELAMQTRLSALQYFEVAGDVQGIFDTYMFLIANYINLNLPQKVVEYLEKARMIAEKEDNNRMRFSLHEQQSSLYAQRAAHFFELQQMDSVSYYDQLAAMEIDQAIELVEKYGHKGDAIYIYNNGAAIYGNKGDSETAEALLKKSVQISTTFDSKIDLIQTKYALAGLYNYLGKYDAVLREAKDGYQKARTGGFRLHQSYLLDLLWQANNQKGNYESAFQYLLEYHQLRDSLTNVEKTKIISELEVEYQTAKKEREILQKSNDILILDAANTKLAKRQQLLMAGIVFFALLTWLILRLKRTRKERNDKKILAEALMMAQEEERKRIAQDLHDGVGQSLLLIKKELSQNNQVSIGNQQLISQTLEEVRAISRSLHPFQLEKIGLKAAIIEVLNKAEQVSNLFVTHDIDDDVNTALPKQVRIHLYRTIQEAVNNILKHAEASAAQVLIHRNEGGFLVKIQDDGKGFDYELTIVTSRSLGLRTMQERVTAIGGQLRVTPISTGGTKIELQLPV